MLELNQAHLSGPMPRNLNTIKQQAESAEKPTGSATTAVPAEAPKAEQEESLLKISAQMSRLATTSGDSPPKLTSAASAAEAAAGLKGESFMEAQAGNSDSLRQLAALLLD
ncbi:MULTISPECIES: hypothetical protein [Thiorhodovibrio]|uniref:hypothetical protein n=1 Tax=Thiorhodovibrio TaxID=61593 RepID=UPI00191201A8|nr:MULTISPECIES: hypothetical protein [Thiorhodovibrio]WPL11606.1 hypothetical protein Thiosp_01355 [Thiorhodovibrio litoralis]